jgi:hypothetical protein
LGNLISIKQAESLVAVAEESPASLVNDQLINGVDCENRRVIVNTSLLKNGELTLKFFSQKNEIFIKHIEF